MIAFNGSSAGEVLQKLSAADFGAGFVNVIDVCAVRERSPIGWERRRVQVEEFVRRQFRKHARDSDAVVRLDDTRFIAIQPGMPRLRAIACCGQIAQETLTHSLGAEALAPITLSTVSGMSVAGLQTIPIPGQAIASAMRNDAVVVRIEGGLPRPRAWRECGASGVAVVWDGTEALSDREMIQRLKQLGDAAAGARTFIIGHGFRRRGWALAAWAEGFTHSSGQVTTGEARAKGQAIRLSPADIFTPATRGA